jgi:Protein involved in formate dehydrogenase formation
MREGPSLDLREDWLGLLERRPALAESLAAYGLVFERWALGAPLTGPVDWDSSRCARCWEQGVPLLVEAAPRLSPAEVAALLGPAMECLGELGAEDGQSLQRFAEAWDRGAVGPEVLFPYRRDDRPSGALGLGADALSFLACASLRPTFEALLGACRPHLADGMWERGLCPFCGAPPGFADILEDGRRRLACHLCGGAWTFARLGCPFCGNDRTRDLARLEAEATEEGYSVSVCKGCRAYVKELDRRVRWNGGPALVEDWGSPHFDLLAHREGYWRPLTPPLELARHA